MTSIEAIKARTMRRVEHSHVFSPSLACEFGVECAIILAGLKFWIDSNRGQKQYEHEGRTWAYFSRRAMCILWPYLSEDVIRQRIKTLVDEGVLLKAQLSAVLKDEPWDRTNWFAFADEERFLGTIWEK